MKPKLDAVGAEAVDLARSVVVEEMGAANVGAHLDVRCDDDRVVTHLFECTDAAYHGWQWAVTVARVPRGRTVTVDEVVLLAGPDSIVAPAWLPFGERVQPGDLGVGDVLPTAADDDRLVPGYAEVAASQPDTETSWEPGLGRARVMSTAGRDDTAERWHAGDGGPKSKMARSAAEQCSTCGFLIPLGGPLGTAFGACANAMAPMDGHVVALDFGCGAHSETVVESRAEVSDIVIDEVGYDSLDLTAPDGSADPIEVTEPVVVDATAEPTDEPVDVDATVEPTEVTEPVVVDATAEATDEPVDVDATAEPTDGPVESAAPEPQQEETP